jgi:hypothetical protein
MGILEIEHEKGASSVKLIIAIVVLASFLWAIFTAGYNDKVTEE